MLYKHENDVKNRSLLFFKEIIFEVKVMKELKENFFFCPFPKIDINYFFC